MKVALGEGLKPVNEYVSQSKETSAKHEARLAEIEKMLKDRINSVVPGMGDDLAKRPFNFMNLIRHDLSKGRYKGASNEFEALKAWRDKRDFVSEHEQARAATKAMSTDVDVLGGSLVPTELLGAQFIEKLNASAIVRVLGGRDLSGLGGGGPVEIPKLTAGATAYYVAEGGDGTESDLGTGDVKLQPREMIAMVRYSRLSLMAAIVSIDRMVRDDLTTRFALKEDYSAIKGVGPNSPVGIMTDANVPATVSLATCTVKKLKNFVAVVEAANALKGRLGWAMSPGGWAIIDGLEDLNGRPLLQQDPTQPTKRLLLGYPVQTTTQMATAEIVFGNWDELLLPRWGTIEFAVTTEGENTFKKNQALVRALMFHDIGLRHPESFVKDTNLSA